MIDKLVALIREHPEEWSRDRHTFRHGPSGGEIWVASGFWFIGLWPESRHFSLIEKYQIWRAFRWWVKNSPIGDFEFLRKPHAVPKHEIN